MVYNTLTRKKEEFRPLDKEVVKMYVCGPTVYDYCHIGHARSLIAFDTIRRYLEFKGYKVIYVQNFTDIDDKMIKRANEENIQVHELAERFINAYFEDTKPLNIKRATYHPRATALIPEMIRIIIKLIEKNFAYEINGNVYFEVAKFERYGELAGTPKNDNENRGFGDENIQSNNAIRGEKKDERDFALWKKKREGEPSWLSPWGEGRPGWHIECSAMSIKYLGNKIDIHGGGQDLIFPHHQNEIAQSEAYTGERPFVKYWLHNGFVNINSEKMSKSLGNYITIREAFNKYGAEVLRFFLVSTHYRNPIDFNEKQIQTAKRTLEKFYISLDFLEQYPYIVENYEINGIKEEMKDVEIELLEKVRQNFIAAMDNDFDTHNAILSLLELVRYINKNMEQISNYSKKFVKESFDLLVNLGNVLGLFEKYKSKSDNRQKIFKLLLILLKIRHEARKNKNYKEADRIRSMIKEIGYIIKDFREFSIFQQAI
ncbi:MAG: cysteine--tRNA ligase [Candidatus Helarchaeota archaeon]